jgi:cytochrome b
MVFALLIGLSVTVGSGLILYAEEEGAGPLAFLNAQQDPTQSGHSGVADDDRNDPDGSERRSESSMEEVHEVAANISLALVFFHILGVLLASFVHHENLARSMITGRKRAASE